MLLLVEEERGGVVVVVVVVDGCGDVGTTLENNGKRHQ